jgi:hypothetical protein
LSLLDETGWAREENENFRCDWYPGLNPIWEIQARLSEVVIPLAWRVGQLQLEVGLTLLRGPGHPLRM